MNFEAGNTVIRRVDGQPGIVRNSWTQGGDHERVFVESARDGGPAFLSPGMLGEPASAYVHGLLAVPGGYDGVEHADGTVHAIDLDELHDDRPLWREPPVCGQASGVSSDEGGPAALHRRAITCTDCAALLG